MNYEIFYLIGASHEADLEKIKKEVSETVAEAGGVFEEKETLEKRKLSYKIKHETHGIYIARRFELEDSQKLSDINKKLNLNSGLLRFILSRTEDLPELKSKEERIAQQEKRAFSSSQAERVREEKTAEKKLQTEKPPEKIKPEKKSSEEDIDKKLEEILNI
jgi:ribosomal protein S6